MKIEIIPYRKRVFKFPKPGPNRPFSNDDELYSWTINNWIPAQPDMSSLMKLFISLDFDVKKFLMAVFPPSGGGSRKTVRKAA